MICYKVSHVLFVAYERSINCFKIIRTWNIHFMFHIFSIVKQLLIFSAPYSCVVCGNSKMNGNTYRLSDVVHFLFIPIVIYCTCRGHCFVLLFRNNESILHANNSDIKSASSCYLNNSSIKHTLHCCLFRWEMWALILFWNVTNDQYVRIGTGISFVVCYSRFRLVSFSFQNYSVLLLCLLCKTQITVRR